ncbi:MAG TPA: hypothetical protein VF111_02470 [Thermoanaerobaculia bacterium]
MASERFDASGHVIATASAAKSASTAMCLTAARMRDRVYGTR